MINGSTCNVMVTSGCTQTPPTVLVGTGNYTDVVAFAIDAATKILWTRRTPATTRCR